MIIGSAHACTSAMITDYSASEPWACDCTDYIACCHTWREQNVRCPYGMDVGPQCKTASFWKLRKRPASSSLKLMLVPTWRQPMLFGFKSPCMMPCPCRNAKPAQICSSMCTTLLALQRHAIVVTPPCCQQKSMHSLLIVNTAAFRQSNPAVSISRQIMLWLCTR